VSSVLGPYHQETEIGEVSELGGHEVSFFISIEVIDNFTLSVERLIRGVKNQSAGSIKWIDGCFAIVDIAI
jgi:hypothetical protein